MDPNHIKIMHALIFYAIPYLIVRFPSLLTFLISSTLDSNSWFNVEIFSWNLVNSSSNASTSFSLPERRLVSSSILAV